MRRNKPAVPSEGSVTTQEERMSVFGSIVSAIFGSKHAAGVTATAGSSSPPPSPSATSASAGMAAGATAAKPISKADVVAILAKLDDEQDEDVDRRFDEAAEIGQQPRRPQAIGAGTRLHRRA